MDLEVLIRAGFLLFRLARLLTTYVGLSSVGLMKCNSLCKENLSTGMHLSMWLCSY